MFPIRDTIPSKRFPIVNNLIIATNVVIYIWVNLGHWYEVEKYFFLYGLVPARYTSELLYHQFGLVEQVIPFLSFMFLHGGFFHLLGNMWSLYIFGDNIEDRLGPFWYLVFYLTSGLASGLVHMFSDLHSPIPTVGASGAIAGVMGAYFVLYPHSKVLTMVPIFFLPYFIELPAVVFLGIWVFTQVIGAITTSSQVGGIAWWAHLGGFFAGIVLIKVVLNSVDPSKRWARLERKTTPRVQVLHTFGPADDLNLYTYLPISRKELLLGARKLVSIPFGGKKRSFWVNIPAGMQEGSLIRLRGLGREDPRMGSGDLYIKLIVED